MSVRDTRLAGFETFLTGNDGFLIHVTDRPAFGNREMCRDIVSGKVSNTPRSIRNRPVIVQIAVQRSLIGRPTIRTLMKMSLK